MIRIYRHGRYINAVKSSTALKTWLRDNLIPQPAEAFEESDLSALITAAGVRGFTFKRDKR